MQPERLDGQLPGRVSYPGVVTTQGSADVIRHKSCNDAASSAMLILPNI